MTDVPQVQIRDDGSLQEVRRLLDELHIEYSAPHKGDDPPLPSHLLISSGPWAIETLGQIGESSSHHFLHLVVIDKASKSLRAMLRRQGCDMVARKPIHPTVLRLILQRALYQGSERRTHPRVAIGDTVRIRTALWSRAAILSELSCRGCGLMTRHPYKVGDRLDVVFPDSLSVTSFSLPGKVVGVLPNSEGGANATAVVFDSVSRRDHARLEGIMRDHAVGPTGWLDNAPGTPVARRAEPEVVPLPEASSPEDRRASPRGDYGRMVLARAAGHVHSLIGRDLSIGGMRVAAAPELRVGQRLELVIYGHAGLLPVIVVAEVVRDGGKAGVGLSFDPMDDASRNRLQTLVDSLDAFDSSSGTVVSEVLGTS